MKIIQSLFGATDAIDHAKEHAPLMTTAGPWRQIDVRAVAGLSALGFDRASETILVTALDGQRVIDGTDGAEIYRNREADGLDVSALKGTRLDHPADERFDMAGQMNGGLRRLSDDGWAVDVLRGSCILHPPAASHPFMGSQWDRWDKDTTFHLLDNSKDEIRAFGFSWSGRTLVVATPNALAIWGRPAPLTL